MLALTLPWMARPATASSGSGSGGLWLAVCLWTAAALPCAGAVGVFSKGPYLQAPGSNTVTLLWESATNAPALVRYGQGKRLDHEVRVGPPAVLEGLTPWTVGPIRPRLTNSTTLQLTNVCYVYEATLEGLQPDTGYAYQVEMLGARSPRAPFRTFGTRPDRVQFIAYGDSRTNPDIHSRLARHFLRYHPAFILHTGDLVARGRSYPLWSREFFEPLRGIIDRVPLLPALGNHEDDGTNYLKYFQLPPPERWYSLDVGPVHVLALDYHFEKATQEQFAFAQADLEASRAPWKVVFLHYPMFNVGGHATTWGQDAYLPLFHRTGVDLVLGGHSHIYERFRPLAPTRLPGARGMVHITTGGGGAPLYPVQPHPALASAVSTNHFVVIEATPDRLEAQAIDIHGRTLDRFALRKEGSGRLVPAEVAPYPEEVLQAWFEISRQLNARLQTLPTPGSTVRGSLLLQPLKSVAGPIDLELSVAPGSATNYALPAGGCRVRIPAAGSGDALAWTEWTYHGRKTATTNSSGELTPSLTLEARFQIQGRTLTARGGRSRVAAVRAE